jgi:hypothetical protein
MKFSGAVCLLMSLGAADIAVAADPFYIGNWTLTAAAVAPWADPQRKPDSTGQARLMGKEAAFKARRYQDLVPFPCAKPQYKVSDRDSMPN